MPACTRRKLAFCHVPRTGGRAIGAALHFDVTDKHRPASWLRRRYPGYHLFATRRPDRDRVVSALRRVYKDGEELRKRVEKTLQDPHGLIVQPTAHFIDCELDTELRYAHLENDLNRMLESLGLDPVQLPHIAENRR